MIHNSRGFKKETGKPVNINISFTINPKNILNHPPYQNLPYGRKSNKETQCYALYNNTVGVPNYPRTSELNADLKTKQKNLFDVPPKSKRNTKRNSVDESSFREAKLNEYNKSLTLHKFAETTHLRKASTKSKKNSETSAKRHNKTTSNFTKNIDKYAANSVMIDGDNIGNLKRNLKKMINNMVTNQLSKKSLPLEFPNHSTSRKNSQKRKTKRKSPKKGKSQVILSRQGQILSRNQIIQKLTSFRSINNSLYTSEDDEQIKPHERRSIIVNTDQSIQCIDQIHELQASQRYRNLDKAPNNNGKAKQTIQLIQTYIAILNEEIEYQGNVVYAQQKNKFEQQRPIQEQFEQFQKEQKIIEEKVQEQMMKQFQSHQFKKEQQKKFKRDSDLREDQNIREPLLQDRKMFSQQKQNNNKIKEEILRPFCSSQMTKQQQLINQLQRIKLHELKKHEVEKWQQLLIFMKKSMENGEDNSEQILETVYHFLQKTRNDLQNELNNSPKKQASDIDAFTNKLASNLEEQKAQESFQKQQHILKKDSRDLYPHKQESGNKIKFDFDEISSMSFRDEDYQEQNQELKVLNLEMIDNALKIRYKNLVDRRDRQLEMLEEKKNMGKITEVNFILQKDKIDKWTKQQTLAISQARKNIWNGYNQAKGILQKSARSKLFQEQCQSNKKKSMMKCLSQDYLLKKNINILSITTEKKEKSNTSSENYDDDRIGGVKESIDSSENIPINDVKYEDSDIDHNSQLSAHSETPNSSIQETSLNKETIELNQLKKEEDINVIEQKLRDFKEKRLKQDQNRLNQEKSSQSPNMSYQEVANQLHESYSDEEMNIIRNQFENSGKLLPNQTKILQEDNDQEFRKSDYEKLKYMCAEDKEDIFEFIFLDLSIELYQEPCNDNRIMNAINNYVANAKRQASKKKGVKTNLNVVKEYLRRFSSFIIRTNKQSLKSLDEPVGPTAVEMLRYMHESEDQGNDPAKDEQEPPSTLIIPSFIFDQFQKQLLPSIEFQVYYDNDEQRENKRIEFLKSVLHIHNKALYDSMNEYLDTLRPFGIWGKPFPWKKPSSFLRPTTQQQKEEKIKKSTQKVVEYCSYVCGLLVDKEQSLVGNAKLSQDYLDQIKQDRLSRMLATELIENEERWLFYDDQETEVLVELSNAFYRILVKEAVHQIFNIQKKNLQDK